MPFSHFVSRACAWLCLVVAMSILSGCGKPTAEVSGTITLNGKAPDLDGLQINFMSEAGGAGVSADVNKDGTFKAANVPVGKVLASLTYKSTEVPHKNESRLKKIEMKKAADKGDKADPKAFQESNDKPAPPAKNPIPAKFGDPRTSGMVITVESGSPNALKWDIPNK
jgi:hypothetical protein